MIEPLTDEEASLTLKDAEGVIGKHLYATIRSAASKGSETGQAILRRLHEGRLQQLRYDRAELIPERRGGGMC
jgi:hypothetical protein